jgi:hypothetical protein
MNELLLPSALLRRVTPEALERMAEAAGLVRYREPLRFATVWDVPGGKISALKTPRTTEIADYLQVVHGAIMDLSSITKLHPTDVLRDLVGEPVSIPAQGWRTPRKCDCGREDALVTHRVRAGELPPEAVIGWSRPWPSVVGPPAWAWQEVMIHDIAELPA